MKQLFFFIIIICVVCCNSSCRKASFAEYRLEKVDSIHISYYGNNRSNLYVCIENQEVIDSLCDIIYNSTKDVSKFFPHMEITLYGNNQKHDFGVLDENIKGNFSAKCKYNLEEILKRIYNETRDKRVRLRQTL